MTLDILCAKVGYLVEQILAVYKVSGRIKCVRKLSENRFLAHWLRSSVEKAF